MAVTLSADAELTDSAVEDVRALIEATGAADGTHPVSEHVLLHLRHGGDRTATNLLARDGDTLVGYAHLDGAPTPTAELVVHPAHRHAGVGAALLDRLEAGSPDGRLVLWAHGRLDAAVAFARTRGYVEERVLLQLRRSLSAPLGDADLPAGVSLRPFAVGRDEAAWLAVNRRAFADHPEQSRWTIEDLRDREAEPWFDPDGFLLAVRDSDGTIVGFHWTKIHHDDSAPIGEVYVIGVDPDAQGKRLGRALTVAGLHYLHGRGLRTVMLYVDESNAGAVRMYERLGFQRWHADVQFRRSLPEVPSPQGERPDGEQRDRES